MGESQFDGFPRSIQSHCTKMIEFTDLVLHHRIQRRYDDCDASPLQWTLLRRPRNRRHRSADEIRGTFQMCLSSKGWFSLAHKHNTSITSENTSDISVSISRNIRTNPLICLMLFSLAHEYKHKRISISISISKKNEHVCFSCAYAYAYAYARE